MKPTLLATITTLALLLALPADAGNPRIPSPDSAPGGFVFQGDPDSVTIMRDTTLVGVVQPDDDDWVPLGDGDVLVSFTDPDLHRLPYGTYSYLVTGHWGDTTHSPYPQKTKVRQPEAVVIISRTEICLQRAGYNKCLKRTEH